MGGAALRKLRGWESTTGVNEIKFAWESIVCCRVFYAELPRGEILLFTPLQVLRKSAHVSSDQATTFDPSEWFISNILKLSRAKARDETGTVFITRLWK